MKELLKSLILGLSLALICLTSLHAQTATSEPAEKNSTANPAPSTQAPDDLTNKLTDLVHAGKYAEAQQLTTGLLIAYPRDQRLIKAKALLEQLLETASPANAAPGGAHPTDHLPPAQPTANTNAGQLTGMDKVEYNALIQRAREAQQATDLAQQKVVLQHFMDDSSQFLHKHPYEMLLWQIRAASAMSLGDFIAGCEAGEKLLAMGAADSNDPNLQQLLGQLKNQGWLGPEATERLKAQGQIAKTYGWMSGTWSESYTESGNYTMPTKHRPWSSKYDRNVEISFPTTAPIIQIDGIDDSGEKTAGPAYRGTLLESGNISWDRGLPGQPAEQVSFEIDERRKTATMVFPAWISIDDRGKSITHNPETHLFTKLSGTD